MKNIAHTGGTQGPAPRKYVPVKTCLEGGSKHKYEHLRDVTLTMTRIGKRGTTVKISYQAEYVCTVCGKLRTGPRR